MGKVALPRAGNGDVEWAGGEAAQALPAGT